MDYDKSPSRIDEKLIKRMLKEFETIEEEIVYLTLQLEKSGAIVSNSSIELSRSAWGRDTPQTRLANRLIALKKVQFIKLGQGRMITPHQYWVCNDETKSNLFTLLDANGIIVNEKSRNIPVWNRSIPELRYLCLCMMEGENRLIKFLLAPRDFAAFAMVTFSYYKNPWNRTSLIQGWKSEMVPGKEDDYGDLKKDTLLKLSKIVKDIKMPN